MNNELDRRKKKSIRDDSEYLFGKIPPQATDLEEAVLGALMLEREAMEIVIEILTPECFYKEQNKLLAQAIFSLYKQTKPIDLLTVANELKLQGNLEAAGGAYYLTTLTSVVASAANVEYHSRIIYQKYTQRELIRISSETIKECFEDSKDAFNIIDAVELKLQNLTDKKSNKAFSMMDLMEQIAEKDEQLCSITNGLTGVPSGFLALDRVTSGWQKSDLIIIAARPGMGKTALMLAFARNIALMFSKPIAIFSLEMSAIQLVNRLCSIESEISLDRFISKGLREPFEKQKFGNVFGKLAESPIFIDDTPGLSVFDLRAKARRMKKENKIEMIIIDYLQLMSIGENSKNREQEISLISRTLKIIAKELNIPVIALSQLSRATETRGGDKRPLLSDLRESGAIEQDADMVCFLYRPEYYGISTDIDNNPTDGLAKVIIAKHRNGALTDVTLAFEKETTKFTDYTPKLFEFKEELSNGISPGITIAKGIGFNPEDDEPF